MSLYKDQEEKDHRGCHSMPRGSKLRRAQKDLKINTSMVNSGKRNEFKNNVQELEALVSLYPAEIIPTGAKEKQFPCLELFLTPSSSSPHNARSVRTWAPKSQSVKEFFLLNQ